MILPYIRFYPRDWLGDLDLRSCSRAARGLWLEMLCLMWANEANRGYLEVSGQPATPEQISRLTSGIPQEDAVTLKELESAAVFSRDERGCIYCRRMVRDVQTSTRRSEAGRKGGGNPALHGKAPDEGVVTLGQAEKQDEAIAIYEAYPRKIAKKAGLKAITKALRSVPFPELLQKTKAFADSCRDGDLGFVPYPATWFNGGRYSENPEQWAVATAAVKTFTPPPLPKFETGQVDIAKAFESVLKRQTNQTPT